MLINVINEGVTILRGYRKNATIFFYIGVASMTNVKG